MAVLDVAASVDGGRGVMDGALVRDDVALEALAPPQPALQQLRVLAAVHTFFLKKIADAHTSAGTHAWREETRLGCTWHNDDGAAPVVELGVGGTWRSGTRQSCSIGLYAYGPYSYGPTQRWTGPSATLSLA